MKEQESDDQRQTESKRTKIKKMKELGSDDYTQTDQE